MDFCIRIQKLLHFEKKKWLFFVGLVALTHLFCQSLMLPYGNALRSLIPNHENKNLLRMTDSYIAFDKIGVLNLEKKSVLVRGVKNAEIKNDDQRSSLEEVMQEKDNSDLGNVVMDNDFDFVEDETLDNVKIAGEEELVLQDDTSEKYELFGNSSLIEISKENSSSEMNRTQPSGVLVVKPSIIESVVHNKSKRDAGTSDGFEIIGTSIDEGHPVTRNNLVSSQNGSSLVLSKPVEKKMRCNMPPKTVTPIGEMQRLLVHHRARSRAMRPRWSSVRDQEILSAKLKIENPPIVKNDKDLYAPLFRNISTFKRSYELMERMLKVYVYKDGARPIFHSPILKGLYASEGWFMKLMEGNKQYVVKNPGKAHLFYMPFSSRMLEYKLYVRNSHDRTNLRQYLKDYTDKIAAKYRFWNRTGGADHFLVGCHDWAPYETRHHMEHCIKALCNADVTLGFKIGRDVSLPETYVRSARNPLRDLGGKPPSERRILAFYAGNMHGYLRPILLEHWKDRHPDMKILGPMPPGVASKMNYISHMKSSRYCICPKGYEVNSPRIVEAIFYECVPVIISDNFVPPFFEILNWDAFSLIIAEKDIPNLRDILLSVPNQKYLDMQLGVRRVQQHFLWHAKPIKYDLFHMTLHSIWHNRVFQIKPR